MRALRSGVVLVFALLGCPGAPETGDGSRERCRNGRDDDGDGAIDCDDRNCRSVCDPDGETRCTDGVDDDGDGRLDCEDKDCAADPACIEFDCSDSVDEDGDGRTDCEDPDCAGDEACPSTEVDCFDGIDNDRDSKIDCEDADCLVLPECVESDCTNELDDDGDTLTDCNDPDCLVLPECVETDCTNEVDDDRDGRPDCLDDDCFSNPECLYESNCSNGVDDDGDRFTDCEDLECAADPACQSEVDCDDGADDEPDGLVDCEDPDCAANPSCIPSLDCAEVVLGSGLGPSVASGTTVGGGDDYTPSCASVSSAEDVSWVWTAPANGTYRFDTLGSSFDTTLVLYAGDCATQLACDDDRDDGSGGASSLIEATLSAGNDVVLVLDGYWSESGDYVLSIYSGTETACGDRIDEDGDGGVDCDDDDCRADVRCLPEVACADGLDEDLDGLVDCDDGDCAAALPCFAPCADADLGDRLGEAVGTGSTTGAGDDTAPSCASAGGEDLVYLWTAPTDGAYTFTTAGSAFDTALALQLVDCGGSELACNDVDVTGLVSTLSQGFTAGEPVLVVVDTRDGGDGSFVLSIYSEVEVDCADGADDDGDDTVDCADSDCAAEVICIPEPICDDTLDDDRDGYPDCLDPDCAGDPACDRSAADVDLGSATGNPIGTGSTSGEGNDWGVSCTLSAADDVVYAWVAPSTGSFTFDLSGSSFDTALALYANDGTELACDDDSGVDNNALVGYAVAAGELLLIDVDGYGSGSGGYTLAIY